MKTAQKIVNNLIDENIYSVNKAQLIKRRWVIFGDNPISVKTE